MKLSIIIPTYNRALTLKTCLEYLSKQTEQAFEIIIIDDGSTDNTKKIVTNFKKQSKIPTSYYYQKNQKQGIARNLGIQKAKTDLILFLGDDILAEPSLVQEHFEVHQTFNEKNIAVLGQTSWNPFEEITPYMHFLAWSGWQFNYSKIAKFKPFTNFPEYKEHNHQGKFLPPSQQHWFFYTSNLSLKKSLLLQENFSSKFTSYGWEDIELGLRLTQKENLHLFYNPQADAFHSHPQTEAEFETKIKTLAQGLKLVPALKPKHWKRIIFKIILPFLSLFPLSYNYKMWIKGKRIFYSNL